MGIWQTSLFVNFFFVCFRRFGFGVRATIPRRARMWLWAANLTWNKKGWSLRRQLFGGSAFRILLMHNFADWCPSYAGFVLVANGKLSFVATFDNRLLSIWMTQPFAAAIRHSVTLKDGIYFTCKLSHFDISPNMLREDPLNEVRRELHFYLRRLCSATLQCATRKSR